MQPLHSSIAYPFCTSQVYVSAYQQASSLCGPRQAHNMTLDSDSNKQTVLNRIKFIPRQSFANLVNNHSPRFFFFVSTGRKSRWSPLRAGHQAAQQPICIQCLLQRAALCAGLAAEGGLPSAGFQELSSERRLRQRGRGRIPGASREASKGISEGSCVRQ